MAESSYPAGVGTRVTTDPQYEALGSSWAASGVLGTPNDTTVVYADGTGTRVVKVRANKRAILRGWGWASGTSDISMASLAANGAGSDRIDTVVLRFSRATYTVVLAVVQGTAGAGAPAITQSVTEPLSSGTFEIPLATVTVTPGATTISSGQVTNVAWYTDGQAVMTQSTAAYQVPVSIGINRMKHYDTGVEWELISGAWRRTPWLASWGFIGGKKYQGATTLGVIGASEALTGVDSGSVSLQANRRYRIHVHLKTVSNATAYATVKVRETNISGTIINQWNTYLDATGAHLDNHFAVDIVNVSATTKTYVVTLSVGAGTTNVNSGNVTTTGMAGCFVEDIGPSVPNVITIV